MTNESQTHEQVSHLSDKQIETLKALMASSVTPGRFTVHADFIARTHYGISIAGNPLLVMGPADDTDTVESAQALVNSKSFRSLIRFLGMDSEALASGAIEGADLKAFEGKELPCLMESSAGKVELHEPYQSGKTIFGVILSTEEAVKLPMSLILSTDRTLVPVVNPDGKADFENLIEIGRKEQPTSH